MWGIRLEIGGGGGSGGGRWKFADQLAKIRRGGGRGREKFALIGLGHAEGNREKKKNKRVF